MQIPQIKIKIYAKLLTHEEVILQKYKNTVNKMNTQQNKTHYFLNIKKGLLFLQINYVHIKYNGKKSM